MTVEKRCRLDPTRKQSPKLDLANQCKRNVIAWYPLLVVNPLAHMECMIQVMSTMFDDFIGNNIEECWRGVRADDPKFISVKDQLTAKHDWQKRVIQFLIHDDGGAFTHSKESLLSISMKCLLSSPFGCNTIIPLFTIVKSACTNIISCTHASAHVLWKKIVFLLNCGFDGVHPLVDDDDVEWPINSHELKYAGQPFAGVNIS